VDYTAAANNDFVKQAGYATKANLSTGESQSVYVTEASYEQSNFYVRPWLNG